MLDDMADPGFDLDELIENGIAEILHNEDFPAFVLWMKRSLGACLGANDDDPLNAETTAFCGLVARQLWNLVPLPGNRFRPQPLPKLKPNDPCLCGSGKKYKQCCRGTAEQLGEMPLSSEHVWLYALPWFEEQGLIEAAIASHQVPGEAMLALAEDWIEEGEYFRAINLLEPLIESGMDKAAWHHDQALHLLCDCHDRLGLGAKKAMLLERLSLLPNRSLLRASAWQRLACIFADDGDMDAAWDAFRQAQRDAPDDGALGVLEIQLLMSSGRADEIPPRADFWIRFCQRNGYPDDHPQLELLRRFREDPTAMMLSLSPEGENIMRLQRWIRTQSERPLPSYETESVPPEPGSERQELVLEEPDSLKKMSAAWHKLRVIDKPFSVAPAPEPEQSPWEDQHNDRWMRLLEKHPEAWDSIDLLDDLAAILLQELAWSGSAVQPLLFSVLERSLAILRATLPADAELPWMAEENRPALRSLFHLIQLYEHSGHADKALALGQWYLQINPTDNHGYRWLLINAQLTAGDNESALRLVKQYPDDLSPEIRFGEVLALYRIGEKKAAKAAFLSAHKDLPHVLTYLSRKRIRQPVIDGHGITLGGEDQAWLYRDAMREIWAETPAVFDWMKRAAKSV